MAFEGKNLIRNLKQLCCIQFFKELVLVRKEFKKREKDLMMSTSEEKTESEKKKELEELKLSGADERIANAQKVVDGNPTDPEFCLRSSTAWAKSPKESAEA